MSGRSENLLSPYQLIPESEFGQMIPNGQPAEGKAPSKWGPERSHI